MTSTISTVGPLHGLKIIQSSGILNRVVEVDAHGNIVCHSYHGGKNQQWNFRNIGPNLYNISTSFGSGLDFVRSEPVKGAPVTAGIFVDTVVTVTPTFGGNVRISIKDKGGQPLYWTLTSYKEFSNIVLEPLDGNASQIWDIRDL